MSTPVDSPSITPLSPTNEATPQLPPSTDIPPRPHRRLFRTIAATGAITSLVILGYFTIQIRSGQLKSLSQVIIPLLPSPLAIPLMPSTPSPSPTSQPSWVTTPLPAKLISNQLNVQAWLLKEGKLIAVDKDKVAYQMLTELAISDFAVASPSGTLAFFGGDSEILNKTYLQLRPHSVFLRFNDGSVKKIMDFPFENDFSKEYQLALRDLQFSDDGQMLAVTVSDGLFIYDLTTETLHEVFRRPVTDNNPGGVFRYLNPIFSPDKKSMLLKRGFYESYDYVSLRLPDDLSKPQDVELIPIMKNSQEQHMVPFGWANDSEVYSSVRLQYANPTYEDHAIYRQPADDLNKKSVVATFQGYNAEHVELKDNTAYFLTEVKTPVNEVFHLKLMKADLSTGEISEIYNFEEPGDDVWQITFTLIPNTNLVWISNNNQKQNKLELRELQPGLP